MTRGETKSLNTVKDGIFQESMAVMAHTEHATMPSINVWNTHVPQVAAEMQVVKSKSTILYRRGQI